MTPEEHLLAAANDMAEHGMAKEVFFEKPWDNEWETSPACAIGSLARVAGLNDKGFVFQSAHQTEAAHFLAAHIQDRFPYLRGRETYDVITTYNDADTTTAEDMILAFKEAAHG